MISQNEQVTALIEKTVTTLDSGLDTTTPIDGLSIIDEWIDALDENGDDQTDIIADILEELKAELKPVKEGENPNPAVVQDLLEELMDETRSYMETPEASAQQTELQRLVSTLEHIHQQVS